MKHTIAALIVAWTIIPAPAIASADPLPSCAMEDGNTDGRPCTWTDPDTGRQYWVDSANYRG